jgi:hypothetical protein
VGAVRKLLRGLDRVNTRLHDLTVFWCDPQSDIVHQSVYELVHSEDREELQRQLMWNSFLPPESANFVLQDILQPENCHLLERSFTVRFRCLLDNTSGFLVSPHPLVYPDLRQPRLMSMCLFPVINSELSEGFSLILT